MPSTPWCVLALLLASMPCSPAAWRPVTFTNPELRAKGTLTGDGCQWVRALAIAPSDGEFMLWCTDVGGIFRSLDGGRHWEPANIGLHARGSAAVAIDPHNPDRILLVAANSTPTIKNGIYLSTNKASSWRHTLPVRMSACRDMRRQIAYDPSTFDPSLGFTKVAYWSRLDIDPPHNPSWGETIAEPGLYKTTDGGESWQRIPGSEMVANAEIAVHPANGFVYAATPSGLWRSEDGGQTWARLFSGAITGLAVSPAMPDSVWITLSNALLHSDDCGASFSPVPGAAAIIKETSSLRGITVAPSDASRLALWRQSPDWDWPRFLSHDSGATWTRSTIDHSRVIVPTNAREGLFAFHPSDPDRILMPGGDYPALSRDGGHTQALAGNGVNNIYIGGPFNFSTTNPAVLFLASQDYATLLTTDSGCNWTYMEPGKKGWGGYNYSAYASTPDTLLVGEADSWGAPARRALSFDQGRSWSISPETITPAFTYGDPRDANILFAGRHRSIDAGRTWVEMEGVTSVRTHDHATGTLYGLLEAEGHPSVIVASSDHGVHWEQVFTTSGPIADMAIEPGGARIYLAARTHLVAWDRHTSSTTPLTGLVHDQAGAPRVLSVAIDPLVPSTLYIAGNRDTFASNASAQRSLDSGLTWETLNRNQPLGEGALDGAREAKWVRVHPVTREPWFATCCHGLWIHSAP